MKHIGILLGFLFALSSLGQAQVITPSNHPNETQKRMIQRGYGMFIHFGVNTFSGHEWSKGDVPVDMYNPTNLDCDQWVRVARDAGFRYVLFVTKHHDGFCLWDSKYTTYDVASSPVKTDVVDEVSKACRKYGLQFGIYYSLWDRHEPCYKDKDKGKYIDYMCNQLTELLTGYGDICELWFDGGWDRKPADWQLDRVYKMVKKLQPTCAVSVNHTIEVEPGSRRYAKPDTMTVDNKFYFHYFPSDFRLWDPKIAHKKDKKQYLHNGESYYQPFEHTVCISKEWNWFQKSKPRPVRDLDELEELFYWGTENDNTLVINIPPDQTGRLCEHEVNAIIALNQRLKIEKGKPLPRNGECISLACPVKATSVYPDKNNMYEACQAVDGGMGTRWAAQDTLAELVLKLNADKAFNKIAIFEYCDVKKSNDNFSNTRHNRIRSYCIDIWKKGCWQTIYMSDEPMGDCKVINFPNAYKTEKLRLKVLDAIAPPSIYELNVIYKM